tara:strand:- start:1308 stop:1925 length:618 start_codon:yes stop_codon:yes gene_type:complete
MKKNILLLIIALSSFSTYSQILSNNTWSVYDDNNMFFLYFKFESDTVSYSTNNNTFSNVSTFQESGNNFTIVDLPTSPCDDIIGEYTFQINNDTLFFNLIGDSCSTRPTIFTTYHWISETAEIQNLNQLNFLKIFPNPASDFISIESSFVRPNSSYTIFEQTGRQVLSGSLINKSTVVDIKQLKQGIYFIQLGNRNKQMIQLIKE